MTQTISVKTSTDEFLLTGKPCELSGYFFLPPLAKLPPQRTFYNNANVIRDKLSVCSYDSYHLSSNEFNNTKAHRGDRRFSKLEGLHIAEEVTCVGLLQITTPIITYWVRHTDWSLWQATCGSLDITGNNCAIFLVMEIPVIYLNCLHGSSGCGKNGNTTTRKFQNKYHPALHQSTVIVSSIMVFWKQ
ncbi:uncharacterized protein LOC106876874 isoform X1 [Octopus bimaculoides]|uniref:uncharacterized protein LOC106876874 isoform X1 n=1 Tax=Octopus bimaculoides TaxID=37653 RepID=UPI00071CC46E|nr:uncharacterized protein LOC106876874 isoform X1 [Octopus bimaculoides]|eukprot:XP_014781099.1 PREDICTED: uncharacterized protein LOC106876874 [Octopus bimaculoides]